MHGGFRRRYAYCVENREIQDHHIGSLIVRSLLSAYRAALHARNKAEHRKVAGQKACALGLGCLCLSCSAATQGKEKEGARRAARAHAEYFC